ncbi:type II toxin-antitoxin system VapC family toxin [Mesorhizobium sp. AaZ16]|uniref:type II toxin-antitoxin system VapC family toxin n=1 Tax=Mesorhizobium sp. AaZ16 TaxID=3402289 RepID=UPI00374E6BEF
MTLYLDTSLLIAIFTHESASERSRAWLREREHEPKEISWWVETEAAAALSMKIRTRQIDPAQRSLLAAGIRQLVSSSLTVLDVRHDHFLAAARLADGARGLRAGDALHLAIAAERGSVLCTLDKDLAEAGVELGIATELV